MKIKELTPNPNNPRKITDDKLTMLKKALVEFGDLSGIVYNRRTKQLVGGHQRSKLFDTDSEITLTKEYPKPTQTGTVAEGFGVLSGERFSYREVDWPKHKEMAANIAANKGAGIWDMPQLGEWLKELNSFDVDIDLNLTMFDDDELSDFDGITVKEHVRTGPTGVDEDEIPEKAPARTKLGDIYRLGDHRLMCGDSTDAKSIRQLMKGEKADLWLTDPPYGVGMQAREESSSSSWVNKDRVNSQIINDDKSLDEMKLFWKAAASSAHQATTDKASYYWFACQGGDQMMMMMMMMMLGEASWQVKHELIWVKDQMCFGRADYHYKHEPIIYGWKRKCSHEWFGDRCQVSTFECPRPKKSDLHPTMKPIELLEKILINSSAKDSRVLDTFGGSGSTLIACEKTGRKCFMMELDPSYCDVIVDRWEKYTGKQAKKLSVKPILKKAADQPISSRA